MIPVQKPSLPNHIVSPPILLLEPSQSFQSALRSQADSRIQGVGLPDLDFVELLLTFHHLRASKLQNVFSFALWRIAALGPRNGAHFINRRWQDIVVLGCAFEDRSAFHFC